MLINKGQVPHLDISLAGWCGSSSQLKMVEVCNSFHSLLFWFSFYVFYIQNKNVNVLFVVQQKVVLKILAMNDEKTKQKAMEAVAEIYGTHTFNICIYVFEL